MSEDKAPKAEKPTRTKRAPINGRNVLTASNKEAGYIYRFVNDVGDRVAIFQERGWELVDSKDVRIGDRRVENPSNLGSKAQASVDKQGTKAFLMRIRKDWYDEDQADKQKIVDEQERSMKQAALSNNDYGKLEITR